jgi:hypothetical protein
MLKKLYSGNLLAKTILDESPKKAIFLGMAIVAHKILTIRLIKLWKHLCRINGVWYQSIARPIEALWG